MSFIVSPFSGTLQSGYARNASESAYPNLWKGLTYLWDPGLGYQGLSTLPEIKTGQFPLTLNSFVSSSWGLDTLGNYFLSGNGSSRYLSGPAVLPTIPQDEGTFCIWFYCPTSLTADQPFFRAYTATPSLMLFDCYITTNTFYAGFKATATETRAIWTTTLSTGVWYHAAILWKTGEPTGLYINSLLRQSAASNLTTAWDTVNATSFTFLKSQGSAYADSSIRDIRVYDRKLSVSELIQIRYGASPLVRHERAPLTKVPTGSITVTPSVQSVIASIQAPTIITDVTVSPSVQSVVASIQDPTVDISGNVTVLPSVLTVTASVQDPAISGTATITPSVFSVIASVQDPAISGTATIIPSVLSSVASVQDPTISGDANVSPSVLSAVASIQDPTIDTSGNVTVTPSVLSAAASIQAPTIDILQDATITPSVLSAIASVQDPTVSISVAVSPSVLSAVAAVQDPAISIGATVSPSVLSAIASAQAPIVDILQDVIVIPSALSVVASLVAPFILSSDDGLSGYYEFSSGQKSQSFTPNDRSRFFEKLKNE